MAQYQSFPGLDGASRTLDKLKALRLPDLAGRSFLDVGCNEGFFCGYAQHQGALRVVGVDNTALFIDRARERFPQCEFQLTGWDQLPDGQFDVILLASALHYADDQAALIHRLVDKLTPDGVLVLELGIYSSGKQEWVKVQRGIDERLFPTMPMLRHVLLDYAWKWMGPSVAQEGDPVPRHVVHISRRRPVAYLMLEPPGYGKSTLAKGLFGRAGVPLVAGDEVILQVANGRRNAPEPLRQLLQRDFSPFSIDQSIRAVFEQGLAKGLVDLWVAEARGQDFAVDMYVPYEHHAQVEALLVEAGFMPVGLHWDRVGARLPSEQDLVARAEAYFIALAESSLAAQHTAGQGAAGQGTAGAGTPGAGTWAGYVDEIAVQGDRLVIRGWAATAAGTAAQVMEVRIGDKIEQVQAFERQSRPDVQRHLGLPHALYGYVVNLPLPATGATRSGLVNQVQVRAGDAQRQFGPPLPVSSALRAARD